MAEQRLLILDDDPMVGDMIQRIAQLAGLDTRFTLSHTEFFHIFDHWQPTHIALDLVMPEMDGVQVMAQLAQLSCRARIIITSGVGSRVLDAAGRAAVEHGLDIAGVLAKPFSPAHLRNLLKEGPASFSVSQAAASPPAVSRQPPWPPLDKATFQQAIDQGQFFMVYQPKILCKTETLAGFEALVRWQHPERGLLPPMQFIPLAESWGLVDALTEQVIEQSLHWFASPCLKGRIPLAALPYSQLKLSVNISAKTLGNGALFERVRQQCQALCINPEQLIFELTETSAMDDPVASLDLLTRLRMMGFHLSIDDFGTGFSSMLQLVRLPFSEIKVDKSFVMTAMQSQESKTVVKFIVDLGHSLGLRCTAEGVENCETLRYLQAIGCDLAQGYHIARPMAPEALWQWFAAR
jgi:EAL domain-containing protein (putative c-di-GMP-specific phosphodiesterase class I)/ActR/RegA family two-component response regulator